MSKYCVSWSAEPNPKHISLWYHSLVYFQTALRRESNRKLPTSHPESRAE